MNDRLVAAGVGVGGLYIAVAVAHRNVIEGAARPNDWLVVATGLALSVVSFSLATERGASFAQNLWERPVGRVLVGFGYFGVAGVFALEQGAVRQPVVILVAIGLVFVALTTIQWMASCRKT